MNKLVRGFKKFRMLIIFPNNICSIVVIGRAVTICIRFIKPNTDIIHIA